MGRRFGSSPIEFEYVRGWEKLPDGFSHFDVPAVCTDPDGNVYLYCRGDHPVLVYDREGHLLDAWGPGKLTHRAHGICADPGRGLFLVDEGSHSVGFHDSSGQLRQEIGPAGVSSDSGYDGSDFRTITRGAGPFNRPTSLAIAPSGDLYVSDGYGNSRIHQFTRDGALVRSWGEPGQKPGQFHIPHDVWVHSDGRVFVADRENDRLQIFDASGQFLVDWTDVQRPQGIFIDRSDLVYVAEGSWIKGWKSERRGVIDETEPGRVSVFDIQGALVSRWSQPDPGEEGFLLSPHGVWVDDQGAVYIAVNAGTAGEFTGIRGADAALKFVRC